MKRYWDNMKRYELIVFMKISRMVFAKKNTVTCLKNNTVTPERNEYSKFFNRSICACLPLNFKKYISFLSKLAISEIARIWAINSIVQAWKRNKSNNCANFGFSSVAITTISIANPAALARQRAYLNFNPNYLNSAPSIYFHYVLHLYLRIYHAIWHWFIYYLHVDFHENFSVSLGVPYICYFKGCLVFLHLILQMIWLNC